MIDICNLNIDLGSYLDIFIMDITVGAMATGRV